MKYFRVEEVIDFHDLLVEKYGGMSGIRDLGLLTSALAMPQQSFGGQELHETVYEKAAAYMYHIIKNHPFFDGNKRTAVFVCIAFFKRNNMMFEIDPLVLEELAVNIAKNAIDKTELSILLQRGRGTCSST